MGGSLEKQFMSLRGMPILAHTLRVFDQNTQVDGVVLVVAARQRHVLEEKVLEPYPCKKLLRVVNGGPERQDSVARGLEVVPSECELVVVHDGARPLVSVDLVDSVLVAADSYGAALAAIPARDTVKRGKSGRVVATLEREELWLAQTPQAFHAALLRRAYEEVARTKVVVTDDAALVERLGVPAHLVLGSVENIKVTTPSDLIMAEALLAQRLKVLQRGHSP